MSMRMRCILMVFCIVSTATSAFSDDANPANTEDDRKPLYELGLGAAAFHLPDYPGSSESHNHYLPFPYLTYRGRVLRSSREEGLRGRLIRNRRMEFDFSAKGSFPADSEDNRLRRGMPDLDWMAEFGPRLILYLKRESKSRIRFDLPCRAVFSTDMNAINHRGYLIQPGFRLGYDCTWIERLSWEGRMGLMFGTRELNAYFYEVDKRFAAVDRPVYHAKGGYLGAFISGLATYRLTSCITIMTSVRFDFHDQAVNSDSPLLDSAFTASFTTGFLWSAYQSREKELCQCDTRKTECFP